MTPLERALWLQAQEDYGHALSIAQKAWSRDAMLTDDATIQAATATVLIHITKLRQEAPRTAAPAAVKREAPSTAPSQAPVAAPPVGCPKCGGPLWDNRGRKKNPKAPDFACKQDRGQCGETSAKTGKILPTGVWERDLQKAPALAVATAIRNGIDSFAEMPKEFDVPDDLPF